VNLVVEHTFPKHVEPSTVSYLGVRSCQP
jgi:hypothetical protein